ncbi:MAG: LUD domain-containing protein [Thermodesulfobacteriota bacterium]|nr:LUD domain-containing protein [Thermodesulfobacteriota bacterium]
MASNAREAILSALRQGLKRSPHPDAAGPRPGYDEPRPDIPEHDFWKKFQEELEPLGAQVFFAKDKTEAKESLTRILKEREIKSAVLWDHPVLEALGIEQILQDAGLKIPPDAPGRKNFCARAEAADLGVTSAQAVILESGSLVVRADKGLERATSLIPPVHLAVVADPERLSHITDTAGLLRAWINKDGRLPSAVHVITGPSSTADIELVKVLGVHGPLELIVLVVLKGHGT